MNLNIGNIGVWGFRHYEYLKQNRPSAVSVMRMNRSPLPPNSNGCFAEYMQIIVVKRRGDGDRVIRRLFVGEDTDGYAVVVL